MKTRNLLLIIGISLLSVIPATLKAQVGTSDSYTTSRSVEDQNAQRISDLEQQVKNANAELKRAEREAKTARKNAKEAKSALRAEKQAQKARTKANDQARKAEKLMY